MQISELVRATSVPLATVKYYLREGLLPRGRRVTARNSEYDVQHVRRLRLLRVLRDVGAIPVSRLRELVEAADDPALSVHQMFSRASDAIAASTAPPEAATPAAVALAGRALAMSGWSQVPPDAVDVDNLARVLAQIERTSLFPCDERVIEFYVGVADEIARTEIASLSERQDRAVQLETMVVGTVAFGQVLAILRRLAQAHHSALRFGETR